MTAITVTIEGSVMREMLIQGLFSNIGFPSEMECTEELKSGLITSFETAILIVAFPHSIRGHRHGFGMGFRGMRPAAGERHIALTRRNRQVMRFNSFWRLFSFFEKSGCVSDRLRISSPSQRNLRLSSP